MIADFLVYMSWRISENQLDEAGNMAFHEVDTRFGVAILYALWVSPICSCFTVPIASKLFPDFDSESRLWVTVGITVVLAGGGMFRYIMKHYTDEKIREIGRSKKYNLSVRTLKWLSWVFALLYFVGFFILIFVFFAVAVSNP